MIRQKANSSNFVTRVQNGSWELETTHNINNTFSPGMYSVHVMNVQCGGGSRSFAKKMRALKMKIAVAGHRKLKMTNWEPSLKLIVLKLHKKLPKNSTSSSTILWSSRIWSKLERCEKTQEVFASWADHKSKISFHCLLLCTAATNHFLIGLWCGTKSEFYMTASSDGSVIGPEEASKQFPKPNLHQKRS